MITAEQIEDIIVSNSTLNISRYSGRGMYGEECPSIQFDNIPELLSSLTYLIINLTENPNERDLPLEWAKAIESSAIDRLGLGYVLYFPSHQYSESEE